MLSTVKLKPTVTIYYSSMKRGWTKKALGCSFKSNYLPQVMRHENSSILELDGKEVSEFTPSKPREKWLRKRTHVKIRVRSLFVHFLQQM